MEVVPHILKLPVELVTAILGPLAVEDQVCFSLSCKYLYNCFVSSLGAETKKLSQLFPRKNYLILSPNVEKSPRIQLLRRLQSEEWEYCCDFWILHPKLSHTNPQSRYCLPCQKLHGRQCFKHGLCMPYAGVVALCPCLTISFRDKIQIMEDITGASGGRCKTSTAVCWNTTPRKLQHECEIKHPTIDARLQTFIWRRDMQYGKQHLVVLSEYKFKFSHGSTSSFSKSEAMCPHEDAKSWLKQFFAEAGSSFLGWPGRQSGVADTSFEEVYFEISTNKKDTLGISFERVLGSFHWPDRYWTPHQLNWLFSIHNLWENIFKLSDWITIDLKLHGQMLEGMSSLMRSTMMWRELTCIGCN